MRMWVKSMVRRVGFRGIGVLLLGVASLSHAEPRIQSISSSIQGGAEVVRIDLSEPLAAVPAGFVVQSPARIALDFPAWAASFSATPWNSTRATCAWRMWFRQPTEPAWCST